LTKSLVAIVAACSIMLLTMPTQAQQQEKIYRIGYLQGSPNLKSRRVKAFRTRLHELGYAEGRNTVIEWRNTNRRRDQFPEAIAELLKLKLDCIVTVGVAATRAAKSATRTVPIVMADADDDPVAQGLIASYSRPGGNVTGVTSIAAGLSGKRVGLLKEIHPGLSRVAVFFNPRGVGGAAHVPEIINAGRSLNVEIRPFQLREKGDVAKAFDDLVSWNARALLVVSAGGTRRFLKEILETSRNIRMPTMFTQAADVDRGGLISYSADVPEIRRRAADFVDRILKGANPRDLPAEQASKFELMVNLKTAAALGIAIPPTILLRADKVIE